MIRELHKNGIACIMEFYFPEETDSLMALRALQFWRDFYHVDGFHVLGEALTGRCFFGMGSFPEQN